MQPTLSRRGLLTSCGALAATAALPSVRAAALPAVPPAFARAIRLAAARYREWKGDDATLVFPLVSDVHSGSPEPSAPDDLTDVINHQYLLQPVADAFAADFIADLGDIGIDRDRRDWKDRDEAWGRRVMQHQRDVYAAFRTPVLHLIGNHDLGNVRWHQSSQDYFDFFNAELVRRTHDLHPEGDGWGYWDFPNCQTRIVYLNTSELNVGNTADRPGGRIWVGMTDRQVAFLDRILADTPRGWTVAVLSHATLHPYLGLWITESGSRHVPGAADALAVLKKHAALGRIRLTGSITGHSHLDADVKEDGVQHVITQSYGLNGPNLLRPMYRFNRVNLADNFLVDVVAIKPYRSQMKIFRVGIGGEACDRAFPSVAHGAKALTVCGNEVKIVSASYPKPLAFDLKPSDFPTAGTMDAAVKDGVRFIRIDNSGDDFTDEQTAFFRREAAKGEGVVLLLARPLYAPGQSVDDAPSAHPLKRPAPPWRTFAFREAVFLYSANILGVFAPACGQSFIAADQGKYEYAVPRNATLRLSVN